MSEAGEISTWTFSPQQGVPPRVAPFAHATAAGPTLYVTGQMPTDLEGRLVPGRIAEQTDQVMCNLRALSSWPAGSWRTP